MINKRSRNQLKFKMVMLDELAPENHLLRKIDNSIDFCFINPLCEPYYCVDKKKPKTTFTMTTKSAEQVQA